MHEHAPSQDLSSRKRYEKPEVVLVRVRNGGDNVLGACKQTVGAPASAPNLTCEACGTLGS